MEKRLTIFAGHYGSGKTNIAINYAFHLKEKGYDVIIGDLDIVNPYFRTNDSKQELKSRGIELICSEFANSNLDIPSIPQSMYRVIRDKSVHAVMDIGGDDAGAVALGRFAEEISDDEYEMVFVVNFFRPMTPDAQAAFEVMKEIEKACGLKFTSIVNNSNLGQETELSHIASGEEKAKHLSDISGLPVLFTSISNDLYKTSEIENNEYFLLDLQKKLF